MGAELIKTGNKWSIGEIQYGDIDAQGHHINLSGKYVIHTHPSGQSIPSTSDRRLIRSWDPEQLYKSTLGMYTVGGSRDMTYCGASCSAGLKPQGTTIEW